MRNASAKVLLFIRNQQDTSMKRAEINHFLQYFSKRYHYKVALMHVRMGQREACGWQVQIVVHEHVDVYRAVVILPVYRLQGSAEPTLYVLCDVKHSFGRQRCLYTYAHIQELVRRLKAPWFGLDRRRLTVDAAHLIINKVYGAAHYGMTVAEIGAERKIKNM